MYKADPTGQILSIVALVFRIAAALLIALIVVVCLPVGELRPILVEAQRLASAVVLPPLRGLFVFAVPTGGAFRGDLALMAVVLLCAAKILDYIRRSR